MKNQDVQKIISGIKKDHDAGNDKEAVDGARKLQESNLTDTNILFAIAGIFIDSGYPINDIEAVDTGISIFQSLLEDNVFSSSEEAVASTKYNISNGCYSRFQLLKKQGELDKASVELKKAKNFIQDALLNTDKLGFHLRSQAMANYGNMSLPWFTRHN